MISNYHYENEQIKNSQLFFYWTSERDNLQLTISLDFIDYLFISIVIIMEHT